MIDIIKSAGELVASVITQVERGKLVAGVLIFWWLGSFLFFKVAFDASFSRDMSVIAAVLLGVMVAISVIASGYFCATKMSAHLARVRFGQRSSYFGSAFVVWLLAAVANICVGKAIVFGFAKSLNRSLGNDVFFSFDWYVNEVLLFAALIVIPITFHFATVLFSVNVRSRSVRSRRG